MPRTPEDNKHHGLKEKQPQPDSFERAITKVSDFLVDFDTDILNKKGKITTSHEDEYFEIVVTWDYDGEPGAEELQRSVGYRTGIRVYKEGRVLVMLGMHTLNGSFRAKRITFNPAYDRIVEVTTNFNQEERLQEKLEAAYQVSLGSQDLKDFFFFE